MSSIVYYTEITIQIIAIAGSIYFLSNIFAILILPDIIQAKEQEASNTLKDLLECSALTKKQAEQEGIINHSKIKIFEIETKVEKWIEGIKFETKTAAQEQHSNEQILIKRHQLISKNLESHARAGNLIERLKLKVLNAINNKGSNAQAPINGNSCETRQDNWSIASGSAPRTSFIYAKVFLGYLKKHNEPLPDTELLVSLSKLFKSNDFFFFAKGGLLEKPSEFGQSDACKICVFTCKKINSDYDKGCCMCCYQWPEILEKIKIDKNLQKFLEIIIAKDRQKIISSVLKELAFLIYAQNGQILCEIESAEELCGDQIHEIENKISGIYKLKPIFIFKINPCLMGGVLIKSNLFKMDNSTYGHLNKIFYKLDAIKA